MSAQRIVLIGRSLQHSKSPVMQNAAFCHERLPFHYEVLNVEPEELESTMLRFKKGEFSGANVTIPYKEKVLPYLDRITPQAQRIGAVNTIFREDGLLVGDNTDGDGYVKSLLEDFPNLTFEDMTILIIGAGGAARAIAVSMAMLGVKKIFIVNRNMEYASLLRNHVQAWVETEAISFDQLHKIIRHVDLLIHCTPVGMYPNPNESIVPKSMFHTGLIVSDIIYNPIETKLLREAKEMGALPHSGTGMLLYQGALAYERWTKRKAPLEVMRKALLQSLSTKLT